MTTEKIMKIDEALREALEPFVKFHDGGDAWKETVWAKAPKSSRVLYNSRTGNSITLSDFDRAAVAFAAPAEAAQAGEIKRLEKLLRQMRDMRSGQARTEAGDEIYDMFIRLYATKATPSREEAPTDEQVERALEAFFEVFGTIASWSDCIRAALKAAGPSAQQRVSEEMVERARKNLAASGIWVSAHGVMQVLEAALSPENGGA